MLQNTSAVFAQIMPKQNLSPIRQKAKEEEIKEIIQNPNDPLAKFPVRAFGYSNEVGAAVSAMPGWGKIAETALWVPALMYLGADIYDKYRRGKEGDYTKTSADAAVNQAVFQALASVILPTAAVKMGQGLTGQLAKLDGSNLSATDKEELIDKLQRDFSRAKFAKGDIIDSENQVVTGKERVWRRIYDHSFLHDLDSTKEHLKHRGVFKRLVDFFGHPKGLHSVSRANRTNIENYLHGKVNDIFDKQTLIETGTLEDIEKTGKKKLIKAYKKASMNADKNYEKLIKDRPNFIVEKILSSGEEKYKNLKEIIGSKFPSINDKKQLVSATDKGREVSANLLKTLMKDENHRELINNIAKKAEMSNEIINNILQSKKLKLGVLKTVGGFISLACLAVPIDHFVHKYIIKKFLEPSIENVKNIQSKLSLR